MAWLKIMEHDSVSARLDTEDNSLLMEVNDGGFAPEYVTVRLHIDEVRLLEHAIQKYYKLVNDLSEAEG